MVPAGFEFIPNEPQPKEKAPESILWIICGRLTGACRFLFQGFGGKGHAELDVGFHLPGMQCRVEKPELDGPFGESRVDIDAVIS